MPLSGKPPLPGFYCPACGDVRRVKRRCEIKEVRLSEGSDVVIVYAHTRGSMTPVQSKCPGGLASVSADRAP